MGSSPLSSRASPSWQPLQRVAVRLFGLFPWFFCGPWDAPALPPGRSPLEGLCTSPLEAIKLPVPEHGAQTCAVKSTEATCVSKEVLKDLLYLLSGREPIIIYIFF